MEMTGNKTEAYFDLLNMHMTKNTMNKYRTT